MPSASANPGELWRAERRFWRRHVRDVLCDGVVYADGRWRPLFSRLHGWIKRHGRSLADLDPAMPPRAELLLWAYSTLMAMPLDRRQDYKALKEVSEDGRGLQNRLEALRQADYCWPGLPSALDYPLPWLAALVRALDADLSAEAYGWDAVFDHDREALRPDGYDCRVVPVTRPHRAQHGLPAGRRAMLLHAILPCRLHDVEVELCFHPDLAPDPEPQRWRYAAALFLGHRIGVENRGEHGFRVVEATAPNREELIASQIEDALAGGCDALM